MNGFKLTLRPRGEIEKAHGIDNGGPVQQFVDSEVLRFCDPYVPMDTGNLKDSGIRGTRIGSGEVVYNAPYAARQYYHGRSPGSSDAGPLRGRMWFARMKADHRDDILRGAAKIAGGQGEMSILESVRSFLLTCPLLKYGRMNVDRLGPKPTEYSVDEIPASPVLRRYFDGGEQRQFLFLLSSRERHGPDFAQALQNHGFYERFERWIKEQNRRRVLPVLDGGRTAQRIEATTGGYVLTENMNSARYEIRCRLIYFEKGMRSIENQ